MSPGHPDGRRAAQLVVDAARFVALGADDVQAAHAHDLVVLGVGLAFRSLKICSYPARDAVKRVEVEEVDELVVSR
jgi:hypothetical protein